MSAPRLAVLVVVDALRADRVGRGLIPFLDGLAARCCVFERAYAPANWTLPSMASLLTGLHPPRHGALHHGVPLPARVPALAETARAAGVRTAAFVGGGYLDAPYGLGRGFELWDSWGHRGFRDTVPPAAAWLASLRPGERGLLLVHGNDLQPVVAPPPGEAPALPPGFIPDYHLIKAFNGYPWSEGWGPEPDAAQRAALAAARADGSLARAFSALYDRRAAAADAWVSRLWAGVEAAGLAERCVFAVTADHGFSLGEEDGRLAHGYHASVSEEALRVPLLLAGAGVPPRRVPEPVGLVDLLPTLLEALGVALPSGLDGAGLGPALEGRPWTPRPARSWAPLMSPRRVPLYAERDAAGARVTELDGTLL